MNTISCLIDFSNTGKTATSYAAWLAKLNNATINLIHFVANTEDQSAIQKKLITHSEVESANVPFTCTIVSDEFLKSIPEVLVQHQSTLLVIGSHGVQSSSQIWSAPNTVHLVQSINIPALVVNENTPAASSVIKHILFPIAPHVNFNVQIEESARWAKKHHAEVHVLCLDTTEGELPAKIEGNLNKSIAYFTAENIAYTKTLKDSKVYSVGYAKDIIRFAKDNKYDLITIMAQNSDENLYFGDVEKTNLIQNELGIPVLFTS